MILSQTSYEDYQRSLILFQDAAKLSRTIGGLLQHWIQKGNREIKGALVIDGNLTDSTILKEVLPGLSHLNQVRLVSLNDVSSLLGQTLDFLVLDLRHSFQPNKVILLIETVKGGGIVLICGLPPAEWIMTVNRSQLSSGEESKPRSHLLEWFLTNFQNNPQCVIEDLSSHDVLRRFNLMPSTVNLTSEMNGFIVTPDQREVITNLTKILLDKSHPNSCCVVVANRGRGKSASVGIALSSMIAQSYLQTTKFTRVVVTAPELSNTQILFEFIRKGLRLRHVKYRTIKQDNLVTEVRLSGKFTVSYSPPSEVLAETKTNLVVVEEAAALPTEKIKAIIQISAKKVLISTIHGYEGTGRGFQYKIIHTLKRQKRIQFKIFSLITPIRYLRGDLIEQLLNETFLLDVELEFSEIKYQDINRELIILEEFNNPAFLFSKQGIHRLRLLFGLLVYSHYRNQPNDLLLLADSGKHFLLGLFEKKDQNEMNLIASSHLAKEGEVSEQEISRIAMGEFIPGNLIPATAIRHFSAEFARTRGLRIVRIAVYPSLVDKGLGRLALEQILQKYASNDWIGVSFGATTKLVKFWKKFGFHPVHIRPTKSPVSGEWNIVFILPLSSTTKTIINQASADFALQFIALLKQSLFAMRPELAIQILKSCFPVVGHTPNLTAAARLRLANYLKGHLNFLLAVDAMYELAVLHFVLAKPVKLSPSQEMLLISRVLTGRTWGQMLGKTGLSWKSSQSLLKKAIKKMVKSYL